MPNDGQSTNPFIRFKQDVDATIQSGIDTINTLKSLANPFSPQTTTMSTTPIPPLSEPDTHLENRLSLLRGGTRAESHLAWRLFLTRSPYSPLRLAHDLPVQPTPHGLPAGADPAQFGWLDAFEDLLLASSGVPEMSDLREKSVAREWGGEWWFGFGGSGGFPGGLQHWHGSPFFGGVGVREMAWLNRIGERGLEEVYFPFCEPAEGYRSPGTMEEWVERRRKEREWAEEAQAARRKWEEGWRRVEDEGVRKGGGLFDEIGGVVKVLGKVLEEEATRFKTLGRDGERRKKREEEKKQGEPEIQSEPETKAEPETEGDLYSLIRSTFHESERSLSNFFRSVSDAWRDDIRGEPRPASPPKVESTEVVENGITKKTTTKEFVDKHGNTHSKTETIWKDENGQVIMKQVHSSMGRSEHWQNTIEDASAKQDGEPADRSKEHRKDKDGGWFWK